MSLRSWLFKFDLIKVKHNFITLTSQRPKEAGLDSAQIDSIKFDRVLRPFLLQNDILQFLFAGIGLLCGEC